eukprot:1748253-Ditylum_brightwellii.AAC.1
MKKTSIRSKKRSKTTRTEIDGTYMGDDPSSTEERLVQKEMSPEGKKELLQCMGDILTLPTTPYSIGEDS